MPETGNKKTFGLNTGKEFDKNKTNQYELSIQVSLDGFSFLVLSDIGKEVLAGKNFEIKISSPKLVSHHFVDWVDAEPLLKLPYQKVNILLFDEYFTLIPNISTEQPNPFTAELLTNTDGERIQFQNQIRDIEGTLQFGVHNELVDTVNSLFNKVEWKHPVAVLLNNFPVAEKPNIGILIQSQSRYFLILKKRNQLLLANCFTAEHSSDLVYFLLNTFNQLGVSRRNTRLFIAEKLAINKHLNELLSPYFQDISGLNIEGEYDYYAEGINRLHLYFTLNKI